jgi:hypothetical protein
MDQSTRACHWVQAARGRSSWGRLALTKFTGRWGGAQALHHAPTVNVGCRCGEIGSAPVESKALVGEVGSIPFGDHLRIHAVHQDMQQELLHKLA